MPASWLPIRYPLTETSPLAALRPKRRDDVRSARTPVESGHDRALDLEGVHEGDDVEGQRRLLAVADSLLRQERRRAVAAEIRDEHAVPSSREQRDDLGVAVDVVRPAMQKDNRRAVCRPGIYVADVQNAGVNLPDGAERRVRPRRDSG